MIVTNQSITTPSAVPQAILVPVHSGRTIKTPAPTTTTIRPT